MYICDMEEIWKDIEGYEGLYQVSNLGKVRSMNRIDSKGHKRGGFIMKQKINKYGYCVIGLCKNGRQIFCLVHRLVGKAFIPNPECLPLINHKDECKANNVWTNLEWCDAQYNLNYGTIKERTANRLNKPVFQIKNGVIVKRWMSLKEAEEKGFQHSCISLCCRGILKKHKGFQWEYAT